MEGMLWGSLPEHILDRVLTMLPVKSLFRFRAVCKRWNDFPSSHSFLDACSSDQPKCCETWLVVTNSHRSFAYNPYSKKLSNLAPPLFQDLWYSDFLASSEGLILRASSSCSPQDGTLQAAASSIHICNPFTGFVRQLPQVVGRPCAAQILIDPSGHRYRIVALCVQQSDTSQQEEPHRWSLESYNSVGNCWQVLCSKVPVEIIMQDTISMVVCNEIAYCAIGVRIPSDVWEFHFQTSTWYRVGLPALPAYARYHLVGCQGRLLLVARIKEQQHPDATLIERIHIWQLEQSKKLWTHMLEVPDEMLGQMGSRGWALSCCAYGDLLILIFKDMLWTKILVYNFTTDQIHCGPCLYTVLSTTEFLFYPRLSALVWWWCARSLVQILIQSAGPTTPPHTLSVWCSYPCNLLSTRKKRIGGQGMWEALLLLFKLV